MGLVGKGSKPTVFDEGALVDAGVEVEVDFTPRIAITEFRFACALSISSDDLGLFFVGSVNFELLKCARTTAAENLLALSVLVQK